MLRHFVLSFVLLSGAAQAQVHLEAFEAAWMKGQPAAALEHVADNALFIWSVDSATPKRVSDVTMTGKEQGAGFLEAFLPGLQITAKERANDGKRVTYDARISYAWLKQQGLDGLDVKAEVVLQPDGKVRSYALRLTEPSSKALMAVLPEANRAAVTAFYEAVNKKDDSVLDTVISSAFVQHSMWPVGPGRQGLKDLYANMRKAFPDAHFTIDDLVADGDRVAARMTARYTHRGEFLGVPPTGKALTVLKMDFFRYLNGKCIEHWDSLDRYGLLQQMGVTTGGAQWTRTPGYEEFR